MINNKKYINYIVVAILYPLNSIYIYSIYYLPY